MIHLFIVFLSFLHASGWGEAIDLRSALSDNANGIETPPIP
jgi:hypothetical protein